MKVLEVNADQIIDIGLDLAKTTGFSAITIREVADQAGVSVGTLYNLFGDKESLVDSIIHRFWQGTLSTDLEQIEAESIPFIPKLEKLYSLLQSRSSEFHNILLHHPDTKNPPVSGKACERYDVMRVIERRTSDLLSQYPKLGKAFSKEIDRQALGAFIADNFLILLRHGSTNLGLFGASLAAYLQSIAPDAEDEIR